MMSGTRQSERENKAFMRYFAPVTLAVLTAFAMTLGAAAADNLDRTVLPIPEPQPPTYTELDVRNAKPPPREPDRPRPG